MGKERNEDILNNKCIYRTRIRSGVRVVDLEGDLSSGDSGEWSFCRAGGMVA